MVNKQGQGRIDWTDYTWNPVTGCLHECEYCYVRRLNNRFGYDMKPKIHHKRLQDLNGVKSPSKIFVCSTGDLFGEWVSDDWIMAVLTVIKRFPQHTFQLLTKNPNRYYAFVFPENCWIGATTDTQNHAGTFTDTLLLLNHPGIKFISAEPLLEDIGGHIDYAAVDWIIIGADSTPGAKKPPMEWADEIIARAREYGTAVWVKYNYKYPESIKEFPVKRGV